ncbi:cysteine desulfurase NifS [soil metagenome]
MNEIVYLDNAATTPLDPRVLEAMLPYLRGQRGNPSSLHAAGTGARDALENARESVSSLVGAAPNEIVFTSGGTEADNLAVLGLARAADEKRHVLISVVEHAAVREPANHLRTLGYEVEYLAVDDSGLVAVEDFADSLRSDTALAAVVWANNEVGTVQPVEELANVCAERGVPFHSDAVQAAGRLPIDVNEVPVSTLALSSHKLYGPQGIGALYVREDVSLDRVVFGGGQERGFRSGTESVADIAGFGEAARLANGEMAERGRNERGLRDYLISALTAIPGVRLNGHPEKRLTNNVHLAVEGVEAEGLVLLCDAAGYAIGSGSACSSGGHKASPVLLAMGRGEREAFSVVRVTVGKDNTLEEVKGFVEIFSGAVDQLRRLSPVYNEIEV